MLTVRQAKGEGLSDDITRFNVELNTVDGYDQGFGNSVLKAGLHLSPFLTSITKNPPKNHAKLLVRANKYILVEDMNVSKKELKEHD